MQIKSGIYQIKNLVNGKIYIGSAVNINIRWNKHKSRLNNNSHGNTHLQSAWNKYGAKNFEFSILEFIGDNIILRQTEQLYLNRYRPFDSNIIYNQCEEANKPPKVEMTKEIRNKISKSLKGENSPWFGKHHSEETRQQISQKKKQYYKDHAEAKLKNSESLKKYYEKVPDARQKNSESQKEFYRNGGKNATAISVICVESGKVYESLRQASQDTKISHGNICSCCKDKRDSAGGLHWEYSNDVKVGEIE